MIIKLARIVIRLYRLADPYTYTLINVFNKLVCFVVGHNIKRGYKAAYESDWCHRCFAIEEELEKFTTPDYFRWTYCWLIEREWKWFDNFDFWMIEKFGNKLPKWWEY